MEKAALILSPSKALILSPSKEEGFVRSAPSWFDGLTMRTVLRSPS